MKNSITLERGKCRIEVGKPSSGNLNLITYFKPLDLPIFLCELESCKTVGYLANIAYYGEGLGGISLKLNSNVSLEDVVGDIMHALDIQIDNGQSFVANE
jgi:hypothetical protein